MNPTIELSKKLRAIADSVKQQIIECTGEPIPFTLIVYTPDRASYISTVQREDSIREIKNLLDLWEKGMPDIEAHKFS